MEDHEVGVFVAQNINQNLSSKGGNMTQLAGRNLGEQFDDKLDFWNHTNDLLWVPIALATLVLIVFVFSLFVLRVVEMGAGVWGWEGGRGPIDANYQRQPDVSSAAPPSFGTRATFSFHFIIIVLFYRVFFYTKQLDLGFEWFRVRPKHVFGGE